MPDAAPILVPLDGSEVAEGALPYAAALARVLGAPLVLVTTWEGTESELGVNFPAMAVEIEQKAREHFDGYLENIRRRIADGLQIETQVRSGDASEEILNAVRETHARMLVIATHGRSGISRWLYGSTAGHILRHAPVPVVAVGPHSLRLAKTSVEIKHIMVALDGSPLSEHALPYARELASAMGARISLVRAVRWAVQAYPYTLPDAYIPQVDQELEAGAKAYLRRQQESIQGVDVAAFVIRGAVAEGLLEFIEKESVDFVIMTTHARRGLARAALGSVADRVIQGQSPVMLIRPAEK